MLDVFGQEVVHIIADAVAKGVTDLAHAVKVMQVAKIKGVEL